MNEERYGMLVVIGELAINGTKYKKCLCDCGAEKNVRSYSLKNGDTKSCGCYRVNVKTIHGFCGTRLQGIFENIVQRCTNKNSARYYRYGGRGIRISNEWPSVKEFGEWALLNGYKDCLQIDRIDNNGDYSPENCRWVNRNVNQHNKSAYNKHSKYKGVRKYKGKWNARITVNYKQISLGTYDKEEDAAIAYNKKAIEIYGKDASINKVV